jgi:predicted TIM-barrel fold metal-dependent hydrolase
VRSHPRLRLVITHADREFIEQVHWGATPEEASRLLWDISWIWGPPEDHLAHLIATLGAERFCFGTGTPLRLPETSVARLDLTPLSPADRAAIESTNANSWSPPPA